MNGQKTTGNAQKAVWALRLLLVIAGFMFVLFRPDQLSRHGMFYGGDDFSYFSHASSLAFQKFPDYSFEYFTQGNVRPKHSIGAGIMAAPFVWAFSFADRFADPSVLEKRTADNVRHSWSGFGFFVATQVYFYAACLLLYYFLAGRFSPVVAFWSVVLMVLVQGVPLCVFRRPIFSHTYVFFLHVAMLLLCSRGFKEGKGAALRFLLFSLLAALTFLVRYEQALFSVLYLLVYFILNSSGPLKRRWAVFVGALFVTLLIVVYFMRPFPYPAVPGEQEPVMAVSSADLVPGDSSGAVLPGKPIFPTLHFSDEGMKFSKGSYAAVLFSSKAGGWQFYVQRFWHVLTGLDWGLIFTAPFLLLAWGGFKKSRPLMFRGYGFLLAALGLNLFIVLKWGGQGSWYGYRYLIFSAIPLLALLFSFLVQEVLDRKCMFWLLLVLGIMPLLSMICFEGNRSNLGLAMAPNSTWQNDWYQWEVINTVTDFGGSFLPVLLRGLPLYLTCFMVLLVDPQQQFFCQLGKTYFSFQPEVLLKVFIVMLMPLLAALIILWIQRRRPK